MKHLLLTLICLEFFRSKSSQIFGPIRLELGGRSEDIDISEDGSTILFSVRSEKKVSVYKNSGSGFYSYQNFYYYYSPYNVAIHSQGRILLIETGQIWIYKITQDGVYDLIDRKPYYEQVWDLMITKDEKYIIVGYKSGVIRIFQKNETYDLVQVLNDSTNRVQGLSITDDMEILAAGSFDSHVWIYQRINSTYILSQSIFVDFAIHSVKIDKQKLFIAGKSEKILFYRFDEGEYVFVDEYITNQTQIYQMAMTDDFKTFVYGAWNETINIVQSYNETDQQIFSLYLSTRIKCTILNKQNLYYLVTTYDDELLTFYRCPPQCLKCAFPNNCTQCSKGYVLVGVKCMPRPTRCVNNEFHEGSCKEYCSRQCKTCNQTKYDCFECAEFYAKDDDGECKIESESLNIFTGIRPIINIFRRRGMKWLFLAVDDLWLYQYHQNEYNGIIQRVFKTISFIEEKQWEIIGLQQITENLRENEIRDLPDYDFYSNPKYIRQTRNNNALLDSILEYMVFFITLTIILVFVLQKIFYLLFNYEISKFLRSYSFWLILGELLIQNNIEFFTFVGFRAFQTSFAFSFVSKCMNAFSILFLFLVIFATFTSYVIYYTQYGKLARYFLINMYRFPSSYALMIVCYGIRPFLKGIIHAMLYQDWEAQIWLLIAVEVLVVITIIVFEIVLDSHKSTFILILEILYSAFLIILNILFLCKYDYNASDPQLVQDIQVITEIVIYSMLSIMFMRILMDIKEVIACKCEKLSSSVSPHNVPQNTIKFAKDKNKKKSKPEETDDGVRIKYKEGKKMLEMDYKANTKVQIELNETEKSEDHEVIGHFMETHKELKEETEIKQNTPKKSNFRNLRNLNKKEKSQYIAEIPKKRVKTQIELKDL